MFVGILGNTLVVIVYTLKKNKSPANCYMLALGGLDLFACAFIHPYVTWKLFNPDSNYSQTHLPLCKLFEYLIHSNLLTEGLVIFTISVDRYFAVLQPLKFVNAMSRTKVLLSASLIIGPVFSVPILEFYGPRAVNVKVYTELKTVYKCDYQDSYQNTFSQAVYGSLTMCIFMGCFVTALILYSAIAKILVQQKRRVGVVTIDTLRSYHLKINAPDKGKVGTEPRVHLAKSIAIQECGFSTNEKKKYDVFEMNIKRTDSFASMHSYWSQTSDAMENQFDEELPKQGTSKDVQSDENNESANEIVKKAKEVEHGSYNTYHIEHRKDRKKCGDQFCTNETVDKSTFSKGKSLVSKGRHVKRNPSEAAGTSGMTHKISENKHVTKSETNLNVKSTMVTKKHTHSTDNKGRQKITNDKKNKVSLSGNGLKPNPRPVYLQKIKSAKGATLLFLVSVAFFLTWVPFWFLKVARIVDHQFWKDKSKGEISLENFLLHLFYLNNAINPIVYTFMNAAFRMDLKRLYISSRRRVFNFFS